MSYADTSTILTLPVDPHKLTVNCPRRGCEVPFDTCRTCKFAWSVRDDSESGCSYVLCEVEPGPGDGRRNSASMSEA